MGNFVDIYDLQFGLWHVIGESPMRKNNQLYWFCECSCEKHTRRYVLGTSLRARRSQSCGCLNRKISVAICKNRATQNKYDLSGEYGVGWTDSGQEFYFDLDDFDKIKHYHWHTDKYGYIVACVDTTTIKMHRIIMDCPQDKYVDHICHRPYDNRKSQLRICTASENCMNSKIPINNTSGAKGVCWDKSRNLWEAYIQLNGKKKYLGRFDNLQDAIDTRTMAEEKYFGEFSYNNSMKQ